MVELQILVGSTSAVLALLAAFAVYAVGPGRTTNRVLAIFLFFEAATQVAAAIGMRPLPLPDSVGYAGVFWFAVVGSLSFYLLLLRTLDTPLVSPLRSRAFPLALAAIAIVLLALVHAQIRGGDVEPDDGVLRGLDLSVGIVPLFGFVAAFHALRRASPGSARRAQARAFMLAFGARDALFLLYALASIAEGPGRLAPWGHIFGLASPFYAPLLFVPLLAYGVLQTQLFDIDLKLKRGIRTGALGGAFVAAFFLASEGAQLLLSERMGPWIGLAACAMLAFAFSPLQRAADRLAGAAMPGVSASTEYLAFRKLEVYKAAIESAHESGGITEKERESLARLRGKLGIRIEDAASIERDVVTAAPSST